MGMTNADEKKRVGEPRAAYIHTYITVHPLPVVPTYMVGFESEPTAATDGHARTEANEKRKLSAAAANPQFHNLRCERQRDEGQRGNGNVDVRDS